MKFKSVFCFYVILAAAAFLQSGCALFLIGAGAAGGYSISQDEIEGMADTSMDRVYRAAREVVKTQGVVTYENPAKGIINADVDKSKVEIHIDQVTPKTVRTRIKARKASGLFPDIETAQDLYDQMVRKIR